MPRIHNPDFKEIDESKTPIKKAVKINMLRETREERFESALINGSEVQYVNCPLCGRSFPYEKRTKGGIKKRTDFKFKDYSAKGGPSDKKPYTILTTRIGGGSISAVTPYGETIKLPTGFFNTGEGKDIWELAEEKHHLFMEIYEKTYWLMKALEDARKQSDITVEEIFGDDEEIILPFQ